VDVDVSELMLHQGIRVRDVATSPKWKALTEGEAMLVHVIMPKAEEAPAPADAVAAAATATPAEPEVIKKGKKEEVDEEKEEKKK
jgi:large subunit ribosomal protein L25